MRALLTDPLARYRVLANVVGVVLLVLVLVAMPAKYLADRPGLVSAIGPVHGVFYMVYLAATFDVGRRFRWPLMRTVAVMLAGTVPFLSFVAERRTTRLVQAQLSATGRRG